MSKQDRQGVRTAQDIVQRYDFSKMSGGGGGSEKIEQLNIMVSQYMTQINGELAAVKEEVSKLKESSPQVDSIHPVGAIYISVSEIDPSELFGGSWERFAQGQIIIGVAEGTQDLAAPEVSGQIAHAAEQAGNAVFELDEDGYLLYETEEGDSVPPDAYVTCYIWKRIA